jgi:hypothetical protein
MPAPISIVQTHVHSLRLRNGAEALVARVMTADGVAGFGFSLGPEALPARDMAAWDALGRSRNVPLYALFGSKRRESVAIVRGQPGGPPQVDPFEIGSIEAVRSRMRSTKRVSSLHPVRTRGNSRFAPLSPRHCRGNQHRGLLKRPKPDPLACPMHPASTSIGRSSRALRGLRWI